MTAALLAPATVVLGPNAPTTQTGILILPCSVCATTHPVTRRHCPVCGSPSLFQAAGLCHRAPAITAKEKP